MKRGGQGVLSQRPFAFEYNVTFSCVYTEAQAEKGNTTASLSLKALSVYCHIMVEKKIVHFLVLE